MAETLTGPNMAQLTQAGRKKLPAKEFAGSDRSYPVEDRAHAADAKARAAEMHNKGLISDSELSRINAKANKVLAHGKGQVKK